MRLPKVLTLLCAVVLALLVLSFSIAVPILFRPFYYFQIDAVMREGEPIPLERLRENIRRILFNRRKGEIIRQHEEELRMRAEENGEVKVFGGKRDPQEPMPQGGTNTNNEAKR